MPPVKRMKLESRFPAVKKAAWETVRSARDRALDDGQAEAKRRIARADARRGYNLDPDLIRQENIGNQSGRVYVDEFYWRFFEYGTVFITAVPFMRPAHRIMRKTFREVMADDFVKFVRRRARPRSSSA